MRLNLRYLLISIFIALLFAIFANFVPVQNLISAQENDSEENQEEDESEEEEVVEENLKEIQSEI